MPPRALRSVFFVYNSNFQSYLPVSNSVVYAILQFAVEFEKRASNIDRMKSINAFAGVVPAPHKVNLSKPQRTIVVNVLKNTCGLAVVDDYKELCKFNIRVLAGEEDTDIYVKKERAAAEIVE
jgi:hypothetical protein